MILFVNTSLIFERVEKGLTLICPGEFAGADGTLEDAATVADAEDDIEVAGCVSVLDGPGLDEQ